MADTIGIRILDALAHPVGSGVDALSLERVSFENEGMLGGFKTSIRSQIEPRQLPEPVLEPSEIVFNADTNLVDDLLVKVVEQLLPRVAAFVVDLAFQFVLELIELKLDLFRRPALLIDADNPLLKIHARLDRAQHFVTGAEDSVKETKLLVQ